MQINKVNTVVPRRLTKQSSGSNNQNINNQNTFTKPSITTEKQQASFKGAGLDKFCLGLANAIENGGLFVSFTLQDMIGTNLPRPIAGLFRNSKENKGEKNTSFALKELVREMTTGPSMFIIPGAMLAAGKPVLGKTIDVPTRQLKAFGDIHAANAKDITTKQEFYEKTFTQIFKNSNLDTGAATEKASNFAKELTNSKDLKSTLSKLSEEFTNIVKQNADDAVNTDFTKAVLADNASASFKEITTSMMAYADDVLKKTKGASAELIEQVANRRVLTRVGTNVAMYAAVLAFLKIIPKLYNKAEGEGNSGLKGLMKEETINDKSLEQTSTQNTQKTNNATPSFGSSSSVSNIVNTITTDKGIGNFFRGFEFEGCNVSFPMLLGIMVLGILIPRTLQAKDNYDREEILRRDLVTAATLCFGEKILQKAFSKLNETKSGFVLATKPTGMENTANLKDKLKVVWNYIRPIKGVNVMSTDQIVSKYSKIGNYKNGIAGFCDFINGQGGKLNKVFSLTSEAKELVEKVLGQSIDKADNATIKEALSNAADTENVKKLVSLFEKSDNAWVKHARTINARFTAFSVLVLVPVFLGFLLPMINERATKKRVKEKQAAQALQSQNNTNQIKLMTDPKPAAIFKEFQV